MANSQHFDYIIVGSGLAGLQLALEFTKHSYLAQKKIALIDPAKKNRNDKTWSFWEKGIGQWDQLVENEWKRAAVFTSGIELDLKLEPYSYKSIRSIDFYNSAKEALTRFSNIRFIVDEVQDISEIEGLKVIGTHNVYSAIHVFDSRVPKEFLNPNQFIQIIQHFKGIVIKTDSNVFNPDLFTMMDYRLKDKNLTTFTYVLPFAENKALVEFTYFTKSTVDESTYDYYIKRYIDEILQLKEYRILEEESGQIPMTDFPFENFSNQYITKIGTGGGWVKGSTGYSFKHTEKKVKKIVENIKNDRIPSKDLFISRFKFYDRIFLKVLHDENQLGEWIFKRFYSKNSVQSMFRFLDEESTIKEELKIMKSLFSWSFIKAFFKTL